MLVVALTLTLAACGFYRWHKADGSTAGFEVDGADCERQAPQGQWESCMAGKGWLNTGRW